MRKLFAGLALFAMFQAVPAFALIITFNDTAPDGNSVGYGIDGTYVESGVTFTATGGTDHASIDAAVNPNITSPDGTDFQIFQLGSPTGWTVSAVEPFTLTSFQAAGLDLVAGSLTVIGHLSVGGIIVEVFNLLALPVTGVAGWETYTLPVGWDNLTDVDFVLSGNNALVDNVLLAEPTPQQISVESGYIKLDSNNATPPPHTHCAELAHEGRMVVDSVGKKLYICTEAGWASTDLTLVP